VTRERWLEQVRFGPDGLVAVIAQAERSGDVLMVAWANREALEQTRRTGLAHYWSRDRQALWRKGETSGHEQRVREIRLDCDGDAVLYRVAPAGPACHTGTATCFARAVGTDGSLLPGEDPGGHLLTRLETTIAQRAAERPTGSYTARLLDQGPAKISQKVGEEAVEVVVAANAEDSTRLAAEGADLVYHLMVLLRARGLPFDDVLRVLESRER
jgi:phosphoribosyl-ATP pyrophosphohydrolase/phosphoribosyl-AMP cyclohydrolase